MSIIVPFRPDGAERDRNWEFVRARYEALYPDWQIVQGTCDGPWRKGVAVNAAVNACDGDVLVISDADVMVPEEALREAVRRLEDSPWVIPHKLVYRLNEDATQALIDGRLRPAPVRLGEKDLIPGSPRKAPAGGGLSVMRRDDYPGIDERFIGWGGEDISFGWALDTLVGPHRSLGGLMWHLHHEPMHGEKRRGSVESEALVDRYAEACGDQVAMAELLSSSNARDGAPYETYQGGGIVVTRREVMLSHPIDPRFSGWG